VSEGVFGQLTGFDERESEGFFGRGDQVGTLEQLLAGDARLVAFTGASGVGKTSLLRAGLAPALARRAILTITIGAYRDLERELVRETSRLGIAPPVPGQDAADYLGTLARQSKAPLVLVLDELEQALADGADDVADVAALAAHVADEGAATTKLVLAIDEAWFARLEPLRAVLRPKLGGSATTRLPPFSERQVEEILERMAVQSGTSFEEGLASVVAADLCAARPARGADVQIAARAIVDLRLGTVRRYRRSGGAAVLPFVWLEKLCGDAGGLAARRALVAAAESDGVVAGAPPERSRHRPTAALETLTALRARGVLVSEARGRSEIYRLAHPALRDLVLELTTAERGRASFARRTLARRRAAGEPIRARELLAIRRGLAGMLAAEEQTAVRRGVARVALRLALGCAVIVLVCIALYADSRRAYTLGLDPPDARGSARVVVRLGRRRLSFLNFIPNHPRLGSIVADTGYTAANLAGDTVERIADGRATGTLAAAPEDGGAHGRVPGWLREVLNGLRPVPRGIAKTLLGDPDGMVALKQAFADPSARGEILSALTVIGRGGAGEDEILAGALADSSVEIRRRGVTVAAGIDRRRQSAAHAGTLRSALADASPQVRGAVVDAAPTLPPTEAAGMFAIALRDADPSLRRRAEDGLRALAHGAPGVVVDSLVDVAQSPDAGARRSALSLLESVATDAPTACSAALARIVESDRAADDVRVAALMILRRAGAPAPSMRPALEKAIRAESAPRLRAAALPLYARLVPAAQAEDIARTEMKGPPPARAASAAMWGAVAAVAPDDALKPIKTLLADQAPEARVEAARASGYLRRDGIELVDKALKDPSADVERAAIDAASMLAAQNPGPVIDMLARALKLVRPAVRRNVIEALARVGDGRPAAALPPIAHAIKDSDTATRVAAAKGLCALAKRDAAAASPYLRIAARDDRDDVKMAAAACLPEVSAADAKAGARMAAELADATQPAVRVAAARALGGVSASGAGSAAPTLLKLVADGDRAVRSAALQAFEAGAGRQWLVGEARRGDELERALAIGFGQGDPAERRTIATAAGDLGLVGFLRQAARDGDETVRLAAVRSAAGRGSAGLEILRAASDDRSEPVRAEALRQLAGGTATDAMPGVQRGPEAVPTFASMWATGDAAVRAAAVAGIGELDDPGEAGFALLRQALNAPSESLRVAAVIALGKVGARQPDHVAADLERAIRDPAYDVRQAALPALATVWSRRYDAQALGKILVTSDVDSTRRFVALEALVSLAARPSASADTRAGAQRELEHAADAPSALARLAARIGRCFEASPSAALHAFVERMFGG
jgi:conflict system STAND superfamily ATPase/HEAT repeat protein